MKKLKLGIIFILIVIFIVAFSACDIDFGTIIGDVIKNNVFPYSDNGFEEIQLNYAAYSSDSEVSFIYQWNITVDEESEFSIKYYKDSTGSILKEKYVYQVGDTEKVLLKVGEDNYYIDENTKTVSNESGSEFSDLVSAVNYAKEYGIIELGDEEQSYPWEFVSKNDSVTTTNSEDEEEEFVKYDYTSVEEESSITDTEMSVYFVKMLIPSIKRIDYIVSENDVTATEITVFLLWDTTEVTENDFTVPTEADGYVFAD